MIRLPPNSAFVSTACAAALRALFSAAQRGRSASNNADSRH